MPDTHGLEWSVPEIDGLLDYFFMNQPWETICNDYQDEDFPIRSPAALRTELHNLAVKYPLRTNTKDYKAENRINRTGVVFTDRDYSLICIATSHAGIKNGACDEEWVGNILGRSTEDVLKEFQRLAEEQATYKPMFEGRGLSRPQAVHQATKRHLRSFRKELGFK